MINGACTHGASHGALHGALHTSSPSGAEPVPSSELKSSLNFHDGKHSCSSLAPHRYVSWHELATVATHMASHPRKYSSARLTTSSRRGWSAGSAAAAAPARRSP
eukprot:scaffold33213_cov60-Phaeocystis_antarctica.AAC.1